jgi:GntR family transcriptional regulator
VTGPARVPKYYVAKQQLAALIAAAEPGSALPTERELAVQLAVSRTTLRQALTELVSEGRLSRTQGRGTFVAVPPVTHVRQLTSLSQDTSEGGQATRSRLISVSRVRPSAIEAAELGLGSTARVTRVERVRLVEGQPLAHEVALLTGKLPGLARRLASVNSLYALLRDEYGVTIASAENSVETRLAGPDDAALLDVVVGAPLLVVRRLALSSAGEPVELTSSVFRGDRVRFVATAGEAAGPG